MAGLERRLYAITVIDSFSLISLICNILIQLACVDFFHVTNRRNKSVVAISNGIDVIPLNLHGFVIGLGNKI